MKNSALTVPIGIIMTIFLASACTATGDAKKAEAQQTAAAKAPTKADFETAYAAAKAAQKKAASVGGEWRDIGKFLKQAEQAAEGGDYAKAIVLTNKARFQGEMGYQQALAQKDAGPRF
jgi:uncharacterized protein YabN with tetrapyrrole methylase and pyrophosphatase domain